MPSVSAVVVRIAWSGFAWFSVAVPSVFAPSLKVTVPGGVPLPPPLAATVAVSITDCPTTDGLGDEVTVVVVLAAFTVCDAVAELPLKFEFVLKVAVTVLAPAVGGVSEQLPVLGLGEVP